MGTRAGVVKKTELTEFSNPRAKGIIAMGVEDDDAVIAAQIKRWSGRNLHRDPRRHGHPLPGVDVRPMGRTAYGVRGISLREGDLVVAMEVVRPGGTLLTSPRGGTGSGRRSKNTACSRGAGWVSLTSKRPNETAKSWGSRTSRTGTN